MEAGTILALLVTLRTRRFVGIVIGSLAILGITIAIGRRYGIGFVSGMVVGIGVGIRAVLCGTLLMGRLLRGTLQRDLEPISPGALTAWNYDMELRGLDGKYVYGSSFRGRVVFVNVWATWCAPCVAELPSIMRLMGMVVDAKVAFVCISCEESEKMRIFLQARGLDVPVYRIETPLPEPFDSPSIPATYVVARDGRICLSKLGAARWDSEAMVAFLMKLALESV
jgi:thiol-disulfide isomerase/thioredoxin